MRLGTGLALGKNLWLKDLMKFLNLDEIPSFLAESRLTDAQNGRLFKWGSGSEVSTAREVIQKNNSVFKVFFLIVKSKKLI